MTKKATILDWILNYVVQTAKDTYSSSDFLSPNNSHYAYQDGSLFMTPTKEEYLHVRELTEAECTLLFSIQS
jgi:hypothetical protein